MCIRDSIQSGYDLVSLSNQSIPYLLVVPQLISVFLNSRMVNEGRTELRIVSFLCEFDSDLFVTNILRMLFAALVRLFLSKSVDPE